MKYFSMLIKTASSLCNLKCKYCFYHDVASLRETYCYDIMNDKTIETIISKTLGYFAEPTHISYAFQGGEPTCAGIGVFRKFIDQVKNLKKDYHDIHYSIQTNATLLNNEWVQLFKENNFLVGVSLDGFQSNHDTVRLDKNNQGTYNQIIYALDLLKTNNISFNVLTVLTPSLSKHAKELYSFYKEHDLSYIQIIPCINNVNQDSKYACNPEDFYNFYTDFFDLWFDEYRQGILRNINFFETVISMFANIPLRQCGTAGFCSMQFVVESNGDVYPCDFYVSDQYKIGSINENTIVELAKSTIVQDFVQEKRALNQRCAICNYSKMCIGTCKRMEGVYNKKEYCAIQEFLHIKEKQILAIARTL